MLPKTHDQECREANKGLGKHCTCQYYGCKRCGDEVPGPIPVSRLCEQCRTEDASESGPHGHRIGGAGEE